MRQFIIINSAGYFMRIVPAKDAAAALAGFASSAGLPVAGLVCRPATPRLVREFHRQRSVSGIGSESCLAPWALRVGGAS
jgi:hypothetical protein